jgi:methyltransferase (TIGR00027 family)
VEVQKELLANVLAIRRPYFYPVPTPSSWFWWFFWMLLCNPIFSKITRWRLQWGLKFLGGGGGSSSSTKNDRRVLETIGYRKTYMEDCVRQGILLDGCRQVIVIGGGMDTLAIRLSESFLDVQFWEVDHPATSRLKKQALAKLERKNLHVVSIDLSKQELKAELLAELHDYDINAPTVIILEGLLMYLTEHQVVDLLQSLAALVGPRSTVAFDFLEGEEADDGTNLPSNSMHGPLLTPAILWTLKNVLHEPWLWGVAPSNFPEFVKSKLTNWSCHPELSEDAARAIGILFVTKLCKR